MGMRVPAAIAFLLCALSLLPPDCVAGKEASERHYVRGRELIAAGDQAHAAVELEKSIAENPENVEAHYHLGILYTKNVNTFAMAEREFFELPAIAMRAGGKTRDDLFFRTGLALGELYVKNGRHSLAAQIVRTVIASAPPDAPLDKAYNTLGLAYYYNRIYDEAIFELRRSIKLNPNNSEAKFNLKAIRARLEHYQAAKVYSRLGERKEAIAEYRRAIELDPRFIEARQRLGVELYLNGESAESLKELHRADSISAGYRRAYEIWYAEGLVLQKVGKNDEALQRFSRVVGIRPRFAAAHNEIGKIHLARGEYDAATDCFARAIGIDAKTEYTRNLLIAVSKKADPASPPR
jgi:superkiller protein 3